MGKKKSYVTVTDQFCGAGGSSLGAVACGAEVLLGLNHWKLAIETHSANFPQTAHDCTDISACDPRRYPSTDILITSPECTSHTLAKGRKRKNMGQMDLWGKNGIDPAEERSRATMWDVPRFAEHHDYRIVIVENVVDAALYWPLFATWLQAMHVLGYAHKLVFFNSMFAHPTPQSRDRLYVVFWKAKNRAPDLEFCPRAYCVRCVCDVESRQSWKNPARQMGKYGATHGQYLYRCPQCQSVVQPYYYAAANAIDWSIQGERIGERARPLKERTMERIRYGLAKFAGQAMVVGLERTYGTNQRAYPATRPWPTQTGQQDKALLVPPFLMGMHGDYYTFRGLHEEVPTCVGSASTTALISPAFLTSVNYFSDRPRGMEEPFPTQTTKQPYGLTTPPFVIGQQGAAVGRPVTEALPTVATAGGISLTTPPPFIVELKGHHDGREVTEPLGTVLANGNHHALVVPAGGTWARDTVSAQHEPHPTQTARETHGVAFLPHMLVPYYGTSEPRGVEDPTRSVTTRDHEALCSVEVAVEDCHFRMLQPHEIQAAMAFPSEYKVLGNTRERVKQLGNAVTPPVMAMLLQRCLATLG